MSFSRRTGLESEPVIQLGSMDADLRTALYNYLVDLFSDQWSARDNRGSFRLAIGCLSARIVFADFMHNPVDEFSDDSRFFRGVLKDIVLNGPWSRVYDLLEFVGSETRLTIDAEALNRVLEREMSGYRWRRGSLAPITDTAASVKGARHFRTRLTPP